MAFVFGLLDWLGVPTANLGWSTCATRLLLPNKLDLGVVSMSHTRVLTRPTPSIGRTMTRDATQTCGLECSEKKTWNLFNDRD
jgi:hypothetical protein